MKHIIFVNKHSVFLYINLILFIGSTKQDNLDGGVKPEDNLQTTREDSDQLLNSVKRSFNEELNDDLVSSFDSSIFYKIEWMERPENFIKDENNASIVTLTTSDLKDYHCVVPEIQKQDQLNKNDPIIDPYSKIESLFKSKNCIYKLDSYWTYEICLNDYIRQFNGDILEKKHTQEYYLGYFTAGNLENDRKAYNKFASRLKSEGEKLPEIEYDGAKVHYINLTMSKGTICDLNNKPRKTIIKFVCDKHEKPQLESIEETTSCEYEAVVSTNLLCDHPDFREKKETEVEINCFPESNNNQPIKPVGIEQYEVKYSENFPENVYQQLHELVTNQNFKIEIDPLNKPNTRINTVEKMNSKFMENFENFETDGGSGYEMTIGTFMKAKHCYLSTFKTYWRYSFCFKKEIKMFHEENGFKTKTIRLGKFDEQKHLDWLMKNPKKRKNKNVVHYLFADGDICHETNRLRFVEVKLKCSNELESKHFIMQLEEPNLCEYKLTLESNLMCKLLEFVDENGL